MGNLSFIYLFMLNLLLKIFVIICEKNSLICAFFM